VRRLRAGRLLMSARYRASAREAATICCQTMTSPVLPRPTRVGYSGTPNAEKLGIREASTVALVGASREFTIPDLPPGVKLRRSARGRSEVTIWFVRSAAELGALWICWTKRTAAIRTDVTEHAVRAAGLANGLVDFKIAAIDETWSGLRFAAVSNRQDPARGQIPRARDQRQVPSARKEL